MAGQPVRLLVQLLRAVASWPGCRRRGRRLTLLAGVVVPGTIAAAGGVALTALPVPVLVAAVAQLLPATSSR
jgi:hypothetical protein